MYRLATEKLKAWKRSSNRKPLILNGARQVGKTWLLQNFGEENYKNVAYVNLEGDLRARAIFNSSLDPKKIISDLEVLLQMDITPDETLIIIDEIQTVPQALTSLKYFCEQAPEYHVAVAGSLLGIAVNEGGSFPVGKVDFIDVFPMNFYEFLLAAGYEKLAKKLTQNPENLASFHETLLDLLKKYFIVGGMPEVVKDFATSGNVLGSRAIQEKILDSYERDFAKHASLSEAVRIREIYNIIPEQLSKENKKFIFGLIRTGARAATYETALLWLEDAGLISRVHRVKAAKIPLKVYAENDVFKVFASDIGLLCAKANLDTRIILDQNDLFEEFKGALAEQFVFQELIATEKKPFYLTDDNSRNEIDFLLDLGLAILPIETKSGKNLKSTSLNNFIQNNKTKTAIKFSTLPYRKNEIIINAPLYLAGFIVDKISAA